MRVLTILLCVAMLIGCASTEQAGKNVQTGKMDQELADPKANALKDSPKLEENFLKCMRDFGKQKAAVALDPSDVAETAVDSCKFSLNLYQVNLETYYGIDKKFEVQKDVYALTDKGKRVVINEIIKVRGR